MIEAIKTWWKNRRFGLKRVIIGEFVRFMLIIMLAIACLLSVVSFKNTLMSRVETGVAMVAMAELKIDARDVEYFRKFGVESTEYRDGMDTIDKIKKFGGADDLYVIVPYEDGMDLIYDGSLTFEEARACVEKYPNQTYKSAGTANFTDEDEKEILLSLYRQSDEVTPLGVKDGVVPYFCFEKDTGTFFFNFAQAILDQDDKAVAVIVVQFTVVDLISKIISQFMSAILLALFAAAVFVFIYNKKIQRKLIRPLSVLTGAARKSLDNLDAENDRISNFSELEFDQKNNELEVLYNSFLALESGVNNFVDRIRQMTKERNRIDAELDIAARIQASYVPRNFDEFSEVNNISVCAAMVPAKEVGGDFYDLFNIDDDHVCISVADVSGKGIPAAMFMLIGKTLLKDQVTDGRSLGEVISSVNDSLCSGNAESLFITAWVGILTLSTGELKVVNAGHESPMICRGASGVYEKYDDSDIHGMALGVFPGMDYREYTIHLDKGDRLFLFTDGVSEAANTEGELWGCRRVCAAINRYRNENESDTLSGMWDEINEFTGDAEQFDDITMLLLRR